MKISSNFSSSEIRKRIQSNWQEYLSKYGNLFTSDSISGSSPPSVFVGSYGYPKVGVGPMLPPIHGDTTLLDNPEQWLGKSLEEIVNFRLNLVRGVQKLSIEKTEGRFIENLHEVAMSSRSIDSDLQFHKTTFPVTTIDGESPPFGPIGDIKSAKFSGGRAEKSIERVYYDHDLKAQDAVLTLYNSGIEISKIQKCFSVGMFGKKRKLVPTKWSITATDDIISKSLVSEVLEFDLIDSCRVFSHDHLGNMFSVILFPHRWIFEMLEAWHEIILALVLIVKTQGELITHLQLPVHILQQSLVWQSILRRKRFKPLFLCCVKLDQNTQFLWAFGRLEKLYVQQ